MRVAFVQESEKKMEVKTVLGSAAGHKLGVELSKAIFGGTPDELRLQHEVTALRRELASVTANRDAWQKACEESRANLDFSNFCLNAGAELFDAETKPEGTLKRLARHLERKEVTPEQVQEVLGIKRRSVSPKTAEIYRRWDDAKKSAWKDDELLAHIAQAIDGEEWERTATLPRVPRAQARRKMVAGVRRIIREGVGAGRVERRFATRQ